MNNDFNLVLNTFEITCEKLKLAQDVKRAILGCNIDSEGLGALSKVELAKVQDRCLTLIEIYRQLFALTGNDDKFIQHLLSTENSYLNAKPMDLIQTPEGLERVLNYYSKLNK